MADCIFCRIVEGSAPCERLYEDDDTIAFLDIAPATEGHTLVIPKRHCTDLTDIGEERAVAVMRTAVEVAGLLRRALRPEGMNLVQSSGVAAWQTVFHLHMHLIPRYRADELQRPWTPTPGPFAALAPVAARIRAFDDSRSQE